MDMFKKRLKLREYLEQRNATPLIAAYDVLSAKLIEQTGFPLVYTGSYITGASQYGLPDVGMVTMNDMLRLTREIANNTSIPIVADCDTGWYHAANIWRTVQEFVIIARTEAFYTTEGFPGAVARCNAYLEAGADAAMITFRGPVGNLKEYRDMIHGPVVITSKDGPVSEERAVGANLVVYWGLTLGAAFYGVRSALEKFKETQDYRQLGELRFDEGSINALLPYSDYHDRFERYRVIDQFV